MKRVVKCLILLVLLLVSFCVSAEDDFASISGKMSKEDAIEECITGDSDAYHCYRYTFVPTTFNTIMYNTTVWTSKTLGCGFEKTDWDYASCKSAALDVTYEQCKNNYCRNITHSGYNGTPDFYDRSVKKDNDIVCDNLDGFHIIYRVITIGAPILAILFISFDLVASILSGDAKRISKFKSKVLRRVIALVILLILPIGLHFLVNMLSKNDVIKDFTFVKCVVTGSSDGDPTPKTPELEKKGANKKTTTPSNTPKQKAYGAAKGSKEVNISGVGKFVVVDTKYPGGIQAYHKKMKENHIYQSKLQSSHSDVKCAGGCCAGVAQVQACGLAKGMAVSTANIKKYYYDKKRGYFKTKKSGEKDCNITACNLSNISGCNSSIKYEKNLDKYIETIISNIRKGHPVIIVVTGSKISGGYSRHFLSVVGYKAGAEMKFENLLLLDSYTGSLKQASKTSRKLPSSKVKISNYPGSGKKGYYYSIIK